MMERISKTHFKELDIVNDSIESIHKNVLGKISFDKIGIRFCKNLKQIHFEAFGKQSNKIKQFSSFYQLPNLTSKPNTEYDLSKFINLLIY